MPAKCKSKEAAISAVKEYFEEVEGQDGTEVWETVTAKEVMEDLAAWLTAYGS